MRWTIPSAVAVAATRLLLAACGGDDGRGCAGHGGHAGESIALLVARKQRSATGRV